MPNRFRITLAIIAVASVVSSVAFADQLVNGYTRHNGTVVSPYERSTPDNSYNNNYGVRGNTNPYTGQQGTASPTFNDRTPTYNQNTYGNPGYVTRPR